MHAYPTDLTLRPFPCTLTHHTLTLSHTLPHVSPSIPPPHLLTPSHITLTRPPQDPTGNVVHLCEEDEGVRDGGVTVVKAVESADPLLRVFVHVRSGGWEREVSAWRPFLD